MGAAGKTFLAAFRQRAAYDLERHNARPWLYGIATNLIGRYRRSEIQQYQALARTGCDPVTEPFTDRVDAAVSAEGTRKQLASALARLPAAHRDTLLLIVWGDLSYRRLPTGRPRPPRGSRESAPASGCTGKRPEAAPPPASSRCGPPRTQPRPPSSRTARFTSSTFLTAALSSSGSRKGLHCRAAGRRWEERRGRCPSDTPTSARCRAARRICCVTLRTCPFTTGADRARRRSGSSSPSRTCSPPM